MTSISKIHAKTQNDKSFNSSSQSRKNSRSVSTPAEKIMFLQRTAGNQAVQRLIKSGALQAKLRIGQPNDVYEQEADRVAEQVMRMPEPKIQMQPEEEKGEYIQAKPPFRQITPVIQRQSGEENLEQEAEKYEKIKTMIEYKVKPGESLWSIAKKHPNVSVKDIKLENGLTSDIIKPGQKLRIPNPKEKKRGNITRMCIGKEFVLGLSEEELKQQIQIILNELKTPIYISPEFEKALRSNLNTLQQEVYRRGKIKTKSYGNVCLTFDDGPNKGTKDVLDVLGGYIPAIFFLNGTSMKSDPTMQKQLVERMLKDGHQIGNHTFTHDPTSTKKYEKAYGDLSDSTMLNKFQKNYEDNEKYFQQLMGLNSQIFKLARLPGNGRFIKVNNKLIFVVATEGMKMTHVTWNFEFGPNGSFPHLKRRDWQNIKGVASESDTLPKTNDIILLHDSHWAGKQHLLKAVLKTLLGAGFNFGKLDSSGMCK